MFYYSATEKLVREETINIYNIGGDQPENLIDFVDLLQKSHNHRLTQFCGMVCGVQENLIYSTGENE